jgi:Flp pilus assembly protein TadD
VLFACAVLAACSSSGAAGQPDGALLSVQVHQLSRAEEHLRKALVLNPNFGPAHVHLGIVLRMGGMRRPWPVRRAVRMDYRSCATSAD